MINMDGM